MVSFNLTRKESELLTFETVDGNFNFPYQTKTHLFMRQDSKVECLMFSFGGSWIIITSNKLLCCWLALFLFILKTRRASTKSPVTVLMDIKFYFYTFMLCVYVVL